MFDSWGRWPDSGSLSRLFAASLREVLHKKKRTAHGRSFRSKHIPYSHLFASPSQYPNIHYAGLSDAKYNFRAFSKMVSICAPVMSLK